MFKLEAIVAGIEFNKCSREAKLVFSECGKTINSINTKNRTEEEESESEAKK